MRLLLRASPAARNRFFLIRPPSGCKVEVAVGRFAVAGRWIRVVRPAAFRGMNSPQFDDSGSVAAALIGSGVAFALTS